MERSKSTVIILCIVCTGLVIALTYQIISSYQTQINLESKVTDFDSCVLLNNRVLESYPSQCISADGKSYTEKICSKDGNDECLYTKEFNSVKGTIAKIYNWNDNKIIGDPFTLTGEIPGSWSFESQFSVEILDKDGIVIAQNSATLQSDWMTDDFVPFAVTFDYETPVNGKAGSIVLHKDNPSGLSQNDDSIQIPVKFE